MAGPTGSGKTTIGLQFALAGVAAGEPALYVNFQENPTQLARAIGSLGGDVMALRQQGLHLLYTSSVELQIDRLIVQMFDLIDRYGIRRVVLDAVGDLSMASADVQRTHDYLYALVQHFAVLGITGLLCLEDVGHNPTNGGFPMTGECLNLSYMSDNLSVARYPSRRPAHKTAQYLQDARECSRRGRAPGDDHRGRRPCRVRSVESE